jgi:hypothetical protein
MAVVNTKSTLVTNADSTTQTLNAMSNDGGKLRSKIGTLEAVSGDSIGSTYRLVRVPSNARVDAVLLTSDDIGTTTIADFGLYRTAADGGAVVDADFFGSAVNLSSGALAKTDITYESAVVDAANHGKMLWEQLGLSADPRVMYDVTATLTAAADAAGTITLRVNYVDGN